MKLNDLDILSGEIRRRDAYEKVTGNATYTTDINLPNMLHAKALRSPLGHARIVNIDSSTARNMEGVRAVLTREDIKKYPKEDLMPVYGYFIKDQPLVAMDKVLYKGDIIAAVAADSERIANKALAEIKIEFEELPVVSTIQSALAETAPELFEEPPIGIVPIYGKGASGELRNSKNICYTFKYETGADEIFDSCDHIFEDQFEFSRMHHLHLEPFITIASWHDNGKIDIWSACQNPFPLRKEISRIFKIPENNISVKVTYLGGGFGAKNNCKTEPIAILLSKIAKQPVRFCLTTEEGFYTNTQHAAVLKLKTGVMSDGTLIARDSEIFLDAGAYSDGSPLVAEKAGYRIPGPYHYKHIRTICHCVMTNTAPAGPFRGFGGTQTTWASESQIDMIAARLKLDPCDLRMKNLLNLKQPFVPGESGMDSDLREGLNLVKKEIDYKKKRKDLNRGVGVSIGFKDGGGVNKPSSARVKVSTNGDIFLQCGTIELGQGAQTALPNIVAQILSTPANRVRLMPIDTDHTPFDQGTNASSGIAVMGQAVELAALDLKSKILDFAATQLECDIKDIDLDDWAIIKGNEKIPLTPMIMNTYGGTGFEFSGEGFHKSVNTHEAPLEAPCVFWEYGWGAADVTVDIETGQITINKLVVSGDAGRAINLNVCRGQDEGAAIMGLGQSLFEHMIYDGPHLVNDSALTYRVPMARDLPKEFISITQEQGYGPGPFGSKGMGEGGILPVASAIANAIYNATGVRITKLPMSPDRVKKAILEQQQT
ncbi:MAG: xanthine dehydrogenase family protein molybdopterin-binding subunit [Pseudomonadota bacterium]|nr:xanthine dehydrogenase family protein molybdopterin-binding subunit [Pseudomonadota bacterium]